MDGKPVPWELGGAYRAGPGLDLQQHVLLMYIFYSRICLILACGTWFYMLRCSFE